MLIRTGFDILAAVSICNPIFNRVALMGFALTDLPIRFLGELPVVYEAISIQKDPFAHGCATPVSTSITNKGVVALYT